MLLLLGDQLIRDSGLAVFELVKNAYDADATFCAVTLHNIADPTTASVTIEDDGLGMDLETITGVWLEPGTDFRAKQRADNERTPRFNRLPLGEKGVGRFAVHKLGQHIELVTRKRNNPEVVVTINWADFAIAGKYLSDIPVSVKTRLPEVFTGKKTGTRIEVTTLRDKIWTRGKVRDLQRAITSICSPFGAPADFRASLILEPRSDWLDGLLDMKTVLQESLFRASGRIRGSEVTYDYEFRPLKAMRQQLEGRKEQRGPFPLKRLQGKDKGQVFDLSQWKIGEVQFDLRIFDRDPVVLELSTTDRAGLKKFLDQNGGIRVYRDGMRVFDFGEPGNDWLDLGGRRVNIPTVRVSNNQVIGAVTLRADQSQDLVEKTNREGFIENDAYEAFREAILLAIVQIEAERAKDKKRLREQYSRPSHKEPVLDDLSELREEIEKRDLTQELGRYVIILPLQEPLDIGVALAKR